MIKADIDIDVAPGTDKDKYGTRAIIYDPEKMEIRPHPSGYYLSFVPVDKQTGMAAIDYKTAEKNGFNKVDLLTNTSYSRFQNMHELMDAMNREPDWSKLLVREEVEKLPHIANHFDFVQDMAPKSIHDLADVLALIRPGKQHLVDAYKENKKATRRNLYRKPKQGMFFKKSHAYAYALMIMCVMNHTTDELGIEW